MRYVFVAGCQRSGTTAMADYLNGHPNVVIGRERYKFVPDQIRPADFTPERFLNPVVEETNFVDPVLFEQARAKLQSGSVTHIGDKVPRYAHRLGRLADAFPDPRFVILLRDPIAVANSFELRARNPQDAWPSENDHSEAAKHWNASLRRVRAFLSVRPDDALVVPYESFYGGDHRWEHALLRFLDLPATTESSQAYEQAIAGWDDRASKPLVLTPAQQQHVHELIAPEALEWAAATSARQLALWS